MSESPTPSSFTRRDALKLGGLGAAGLVAGGAWIAAAGGGAKSPARAGAPARQAAPAVAAVSPVTINLAATDGHVLLPGRGSPGGGGVGDPVYGFAFLNVPPGAPNTLDVYKGNVHWPSPFWGLDEGADVTVKMTNIGLVVRPDLDDSHTIHWHGFPNATAIFDGVPEASISVPPGRTFPYFYRPHRVGTFMYHCHFEDVEHVQMGMDGIVYVRPAQNGTSIGGFDKFAYNDTDGSTGYVREFVMLLNEVWTTPHDNLESIQETVWPNYKANYWIINGRSYPDTLLPNNDSSMPSQPLSSLVQVNAGERVLLRFANLGFEQQAMTLPGIRMRVVGEDAAFLRNGSVDLSYETNTIYIGPGEARDVLFTAPDYAGPGAYDTYWLKNRNVHRLTNGGGPGLGGQVTQVRVYPTGTLADQTHPNETDSDSPPTAPYLNPWIV